MRNNVMLAAVAAGVFVLAPDLAAQRHPNALINLWMQGKPAFGIFVPNEAARPATAAGPGGAPAPGVGGQRPAGGGARPKPVYTEAGGATLAGNALYDYLFLNLESSYESDAVKNIAAGLRKGAGSGATKALIVRVPAFHDDAEQGRVRLREVFAAGADGITFPHVQSVDEATRILEAVRAEKINVWSQDNPKGDKLVMMMIEDPGALAQATAFANLKGYSILACGIGSLTGALGGNREAGEAGTQKILEETKRVKEGFLGILAQGQNADEAIKVGRAAAGR